MYGHNIFATFAYGSTIPDYFFQMAQIGPCTLNLFADVFYFRLSSVVSLFTFDPEKKMIIWKESCQFGSGSLAAMSDTERVSFIRSKLLVGNKPTQKTPELSMSQEKSIPCDCCQPIRVPDSLS